MTLEILCPDCEFAYVLDEAPAGDRFVCPSCSRALTVPSADAAAWTAGPAARPEQRTPEQAEGRDLPPQPAVTAPAAAATAEPTATTDEPASPRTEIVCPRCQLHFSPARHLVEAHSGDRPRILLVEEAGYSRDAAAEALGRHYEVVTAGTVDAAVRLLSLGGIDLMVLDLDLDQGFGRRLLSEGPVKTCPIVVYGQDESEFYGDDWEAKRSEGADDMVIKGMNAPETLARKVDVLLGRSTDDDP